MGKKDSASAETPPLDGEPGVTAEQVADYLVRHPDFFVQHPEALDGVTPPVRFGGDSVLDMQRYQVMRLRGEIDSLRACAQEVIETSRGNMANQSRAHAAVLALLGAADLEQMVRLAHEELPMALDVDAVALAFEFGRGAPTELVASSARRLPVGGVDDLIGAGEYARLVRDMADDGTLFGAAAGLVRSAGLARLRAGRVAPPGVLALGSRVSSAFHSGQGTELLTFLARVVEAFVERWLARPA